jgi:hypothetical protein
LNEYSLGVCNGQADNSLNINSVYAWVRQIVDQIFIRCMHRSGGLPTEYCVGGIVGLSRYQLDIVLTELSYSADTDQILCDWCCEIRRIPIEHASTVCIGQPEIVLNIMGGGTVGLGLGGYRSIIRCMYAIVMLISNYL